MGKSFRSPVNLTVGMTLALLLTSCCAPLRAEVQDQQKRIEQLIQQLGDTSFAKREAASEALAALGLTAESALEDGSASLNREIRYRSRRLLHTIRNNQFNAMLERFLNSADDDKEYPLPGWAQFKKQFGDTKRGRELFVAMQKSEPDLLRSLDENLGETAVLLQSKSRQLQQMAGSGAQPQLADIFVLVFVGSDAKVSLNATISSSLTSLLLQPVVREAMKSRRDKPLTSKLLGSWVLRSEGSLVYQSMSLATQYMLPEGLVIAKRTLQDPAQAPYAKQFAIMTIGKLGSSEDVPYLESYLNDSMVVQNLGANGAVQVRDVALAVCVHLAGRTVNEVGMQATVRPTQQMIFNPRDLAFRNDNDRMEAHEKWRALKKKHLDEPPMEPPTDTLSPEEDEKKQQEKKQPTSPQPPK